MSLKVLIGCPTSFHKEYCLNEFIQGLRDLTYNNHEILFVDNSENYDYRQKIESYNFKVLKGPWDESPIKRISKSRNVLIDYALKNNFDYLFLLDQDVIPPRDAIERFLSWNKKALCGIYFNTIINEYKQKVLIPGVFKVIENSEDEEGLPSMRILSDDEIFSKSLLKVVSCGGGCLFLHKDIINKVRFRENLERCEDRWFCIDLYKNKIDLYCDSSIICKHFILNRSYKWKEGKLIKNDEYKS